MAETHCDPDAPASSPALSGAVLAVGAGVLAGLMLGRRGAAAGVAAGVAAAAGMKLLSGSHHGTGVPVSQVTPRPPQPTFPPAPILFPSMKQAPVPGDWLDHDAVVHSHIVPDAAQAGQMLKEKSLPLLDDDGLPVEHVTVQPVYPEDLTESYNFPLGPIIWEPGRFVQSSSDGSCETVWFGLQDLMLEKQVPEEITIETTPVEIPTEAEATVQEEVAPLLEAETQVTAPPPAVKESPAVSAFLAKLAEELPPRAAEPQTDAPSPFVVAAPSAMPGLGEVIITAKATSRTVLPQPRYQSEISAEGTEEGAKGFDLDPEEKKDVQTLLNKILPESAPTHAGDFGKPRRHLEPHAPTRDSQSVERWPLVLLLCALIIAGLFFAVGWLDDGTFFHRLESTPWLEQKPSTEQTTSAMQRN